MNHYGDRVILKRIALQNVFCEREIIINIKRLNHE